MIAIGFQIRYVQSQLNVKKKYNAGIYFEDSTI